jgi:hypothetical protein
VEGFFIDSLYINDGYCDCPSCEDSASGIPGKWSNANSYHLSLGHWGCGYMWCIVVPNLPKSVRAAEGPEFLGFVGRYVFVCTCPRD